MIDCIVDGTFSGGKFLSLEAKIDNFPPINNIITIFFKAKDINSKPDCLCDVIHGTMFHPDKNIMGEITIYYNNQKIILEKSYFSACKFGEIPNDGLNDDVDIDLIIKFSNIINL